MISRLSHNFFLLLDKAFDSSLGKINNFVFIAKKKQQKKNKQNKTKKPKKPKNLAWFITFSSLFIRWTILPWTT